MNFCQKHANHHCVHAHNCQDKEHKRLLNQSAQLSRYASTNKVHKKMNKITEMNQENQCNFKAHGSVNHLTSAQITKRLERQISEQAQELDNLKKELLEKDQNYRKVYDENRQFQGVIDYYREEMDRIIKCGDEDMKAQIKRHHKENTELSAKNKFLSSKLKQLQDLLDGLVSSSQETQRRLNTANREKQQIARNFEKLLQKFRKMHHEDKGKDGDKNDKKFLQIENRYKIIIEEVKNNYDELLHKKSKLESENKSLMMEVETLKRKQKHQQKQQQMEEEAFKERENVYKMKIGAYQKEKQKLDQIISKIQLDLKLKEEELAHYHKIIEKQLKQLKSNKQVYELLQKDKNRERQNQDSQQYNNSNNNRYNNSHNNGNNSHGFESSQKYEDRIREMQKENQILRERLKNSNTTHVHNSSTIEEYILTIGASEAFKKLIQEKNAHIKKLIRQKGDLLSRA